MNDRLLTHEELLDLIRRMREGDEAAHEELVARNTGLVKSIVKRFLGRGVDYEDLYQIGCMGLIKALHNYDPSYNVRFSTYAVPMVAGEIKRYLRDDGMIKVSRTMKELAQRAMAAAKAFAANRRKSRPSTRSQKRWARRPATCCSPSKPRARAPVRAVAGRTRRRRPP